METIIQLIFVVALVKYCLKAALSGKLWLLVGYGVLISLAAFALYPIVINQPMTIITQLLGDRNVVEDVALIVVAESIIGILICVYLLDNYFRPKSKRTRFAGILKIMPGVVMICGVGYFELLFFKWRVGDDFLTTALFFSLILFVGVTAMALLLRYLVSGESLKLEVKLILNLTILTLGLLVSSSVADYNISNAQATIEWGPLIAITGVSALLILLGLWLHKINFSQKIKTLLKWNR